MSIFRFGIRQHSGYHAGFLLHTPISPFTVRTKARRTAYSVRRGWMGSYFVAAAPKTTAEEHVRPHRTSSLIVSVFSTAQEGIYPPTVKINFKQLSLTLQLFDSRHCAFSIQGTPGVYLLLFCIDGNHTYYIVITSANNYLYLLWMAWYCVSSNSRSIK